MGEGAPKNVNQTGNSLLKKALEAVLIATAGFALLNLAFMVYAGLFQLVWRILGFRFEGEPMSGMARYTPIVVRAVLLILLLGASYWALKSKIHVVLKAAFLMVPVAALLVSAGMYLYESPLLSYAVGGLICAAFVLVLIRKRCGWQYYFSVAFVAAALILMNILGLDI